VCLANWKSGLDESSTEDGRWEIVRDDSPAVKKLMRRFDTDAEGVNPGSI
jgi:hypothetical protein